MIPVFKEILWRKERDKKLRCRLTPVRLIWCFKTIFSIKVQDINLLCLSMKMHLAEMDSHPPNMSDNMALVLHFYSSATSGVNPVPICFIIMLSCRQCSTIMTVCLISEWFWWFVGHRWSGLFIIAAFLCCDKVVEVAALTLVSLDSLHWQTAPNKNI